MTAKRVFVSYSHDTPSHSVRVLAFAMALRHHGLEVELDQFHADEIIDWPRWCNEQTSHERSDFVLCVCTAEYYRRIEGKVPPESGKGAYWEGSLLDDDLYDAKGNCRLIPVLFDAEPETSIPRFLRGWTFCRIGNFKLEDSGYEHLMRILTSQARAIKNPLGSTPVLAPTSTLPSRASLHSVEVAPSRLLRGAERLFGRDDELAALDKVWNDPSKKVLTIVAFGGIGKTSLVIEWMARQAAKNWEGFERVFDWSFFSQGTREQGGASADTFVAAALKFFGDEAMAQSAASPWDKGARLAYLVSQHRTLLVLDGLEPLQYPPGPVAGELKDPALATLLKSLAQQNLGLCIVTTRESVTDLRPFQNNTAPEWPLDSLSAEAGSALLKSLLEPASPKGRRRVKSSDADRRDIVQAVKGHALTLQLLGSFIQAALGDVRKWREVDFTKADANVRGGYAFKTMSAYEKWLGEGGEDGARQLAILRLVGLFDRPVDAGCVEALRAEPAIANLTEPLMALGEDDWNLAVSSLEECGLLTRSSNQLGTQNSKVETGLDAHPLIREYFAAQLREKNLEAWRAAHRRLYEHLSATTKEGDQPTLEDLQPLYQALAHGCQAGLQQQACDEIYFARIGREEEAYVVTRLGAFGAELAGVSCFFEKPWSRISPLLAEADQAWLLGQAGFRLRALGRLDEAIEPVRAALQMYVDRQVWKQASTAANNASEIELTLGRVAAAVREVETAQTYAERSGDVFNLQSNRAVLANSLHQAGRWNDAQLSFLEAEKIQGERQPETPLLNSVDGFWYCDLLLAQPERVAWQRCLLLKTERSDLKAAAAFLRPVEQRAEQALDWWTNWFANASLVDMAVPRLTLGRTALYNAILEIGIGLSPLNTNGRQLRGAIAFLNAAVAGLRRAGTQHFIPAALLARAWLRFIEGKQTGPESAQADLEEAWEVAERGPMKLFMADIHLYRARLFHDVKPYPWATDAEGNARGPKDDLAAARKLIEQCGYWRRKEELEDAEEAAKNW